MVRSDIRTRVRDDMYEDVADIFTDNQINRAFDAEVRSLPKKGIYLEEMHTATLSSTDTDFTLPINTEKVEKVEVNGGSTTTPRWSQISGWDIYGGNLILTTYSLSSDEFRIWIKKKFTIVTDDVTALDFPDDVAELVVLGVVIRCYKRLIGYMTNSKSWDSITIPGQRTMNAVQNYLQEAKKEYRDLLQIYAPPPLPRDIDLTS